MKRIVSVFLSFVLLITMFSSLTVTSSASDIRYVESFQLGCDSAANVAKAYATKAGYFFVFDDEYSFVNLNKNTGSFYYIYLGYKDTTDPDDAIRDVVLINDKKYADASEWINPRNNCTYYAVGGYYDEDGDGSPEYHDIIDANKNAGGDALYIYVTKDPNAGSPISDPVLILDNAEYTERNSYLRYGIHDNDSVESIADLNKGVSDSAGVYLYYYQYNYYSALQLGVDYWKWDADDQAAVGGFTLLSKKDLNQGCGTTSDYIYMAFKRTGIEEDAIRDIICLKGKEFGQCTSWVNPSNNCTYYSVGGYDGTTSHYVNPIDLNEDAGGDYIYLFYTKDPNAGDPITALRFSDNTASGWKSIRYQDGKRADFNCGNDGDLILLLCQRGSYTDIGSVFSENNTLVILLSAAVVVCGVIIGAIFTKKQKNN